MFKRRLSSLPRLEQTDLIVQANLYFPKRSHMVSCIISVSFFFLSVGLRKLHAVQFIISQFSNSSLNQGFAQGRFKHTWKWALPLDYSCKPYQTGKPWIWGSLKVGKGVCRMCCFDSECVSLCVRA